MNTALKEICELRQEKTFNVDLQNRNRYCVVIKKSAGFTSYCFSSPVYRAEDGKLVRRQFDAQGESFVFIGSDGRITAYRGNLTLSGKYGSVAIRLPDADYCLQNGNLCGNNWVLHPTFNGVHVQINTPQWATKLTVDRDFEKVRQTKKGFAIMQGEFNPFCTVIPLVSFDEDQNVFPTVLCVEKEGRRKYSLSLTASEGGSVSFEINLYEQKLFQDTTVESLHPEENNAFGGVAFLGRTPWMGEQWLYSRPDLGKIPEFYSVEVSRVLLHIPYWCGAENSISLYAATKRFCSFGSTWETKKEHTPRVTSSAVNGAYLTFDLSGILSDVSNRHIRYSPGIVFKKSGFLSSYVAISTGDTCMYPQILEIQYAG